MLLENVLYLVGSYNYNKLSQSILFVRRKLLLLFYRHSISNYEKKVETMMGNNSTNINKTNNHYLAQTIEDNDIWINFSHMSFYTCFDWFKKLRLLVNVRNLKINVVLNAVVIGWFSLNEAPIGLSKFPIICLILKK